MKISLQHPEEKRNRTGIIIAIISGFIFLVVSMFLIRLQFSPLWLLPVALVFILVAVLSVENFLLIAVFFVPLSIQLRFIVPGISADLFLPTELMLAVILILVLFKTLVTREMDREIFTHPVTIIGLCMLVWSLVTSFTGTMIFVSLKSFAAKLWFFAGFYVLAAEIFKKQEKIIIYFKAYLAGMIPVAIYYITNMWHSGLFSQKATFRAVRPFFNDHTAIGAALAFCIPVTIFLLFRKETNVLNRILLFLIILIFSIAFILSYSRAAWISLVAAALVTIILSLRISWKVIVPAGALMIIAVAVSWSTLMIRLNNNRQASSGDLSGHLQSISNITTDDSNRERLNRWKSALRMSAERPLFGWGPGTYQFKYASFQISTEKTSISTNYGEVGNAHSEYLGALSDSGIPGMVLFIMLVSTVILRGIILFSKMADRRTSALILMLIAGLITYIVHGALNNFLDSDKISALFWGMIAAIVAIDISFRRKKKEFQISTDQQQ